MSGEEQMAAWMKYANPGEHHKFLSSLVGTWNAVVKMWMEPGGEPNESTGVMRSELILGGRFLQAKYTAEMFGQPFEGMSLDGYDNLNEKYVGLWTDTMSTMLMIFEGTADAAGKVRDMTAEFKDAHSGKMAQMKAKTTIVGPNEHRYESWAQGPDGQFFKNMEIVYTRA